MRYAVMLNNSLTQSYGSRELATAAFMRMADLGGVALIYYRRGAIYTLAVSIVRRPRQGVTMGDYERLA